ncbi:hypothetical protein ACHAWC_007186 [Mediolabrus comicus]
MKVLATLFLASSILHPTSFVVSAEDGMADGNVIAGLRGLRGSNKSSEGAEAAIGLIYGSYFESLARNPSLKDELKKEAIIGSAIAYSGAIDEVPVIAAKIAEAYTVLP